MSASVSDSLRLMPAETWKPITGYEGLYSVSDRGRVMFHMRLITRAHTRPYWGRGGILAQRRGNDYGHLAVTLYDVRGKPQKRYVHHLVAQAFLEPVEGKPLVLHGPGGRQDNTITNLRWGTQSENERDKYR